MFAKRTVFIVCILLCGCGSGETDRRTRIDFITIPAASEGGPETTGTIAGRVADAEPGQRIVLYAKSGLWYVQPLYDAPFTALAPDGSWTAATHLGTDYAALLVEPDYHPSGTMINVPPDGAGVIAVAVTEGTPPFWRRHSVRAAAVLLAILAGVSWYRGRMRHLSRQLNIRFEERLAERTRIARELHDTLLQGLVSASMQLHVGLDLLPTDSAARPVIGRAAELMGQVLVEGRNALRGLGGPDVGSTFDLDEAWARIRDEFPQIGDVDFQVVVDGRPRPLHPVIRDAVYGIARRAIVDALRHGGATKIEAAVEFGRRRLRMLVRSDGPPNDRATDGVGRDDTTRFAGMQELAQSIGAKLDIRTRAAGTEIDLAVPAKIAYRQQTRRPNE